MYHEAIELFTLAACSAIAALFSYTLLRRGGTFRLPGCGPRSTCDAVLQSRWSRIGPVPVAAFGLLLYAGVFVVAGAMFFPGISLQTRHFFWGVLLAFCPILGGGAVWFMGLQLFLVRRVCLYCSIVHAGGLAATAVIARHVGSSGDIIGNDFLALGTILLGLIVLGQILIRPKQQEFIPSAALNEAAASQDVSLSAPETHVSSAVPPAATNPFSSRTVVALGGRVILKGDRWPILGKPDAKQIVIYFFDYTCAICRKVHGILLKAMEQRPDLAVMAIPVPADPSCNRHWCRRDPQHVNACGYARLAVAIWLADPGKFIHFDRMVFQSEPPPRLSVALAFAKQLVPQAKLHNPEVPDAKLDGYLHDGIELHRSCGEEQTPLLLFPNGVLKGELCSIDALYKILGRESQTSLETR